MATPEKVKKGASVSAKQSARERRAMQEKRRQRQQQILLSVVAGALLLGVLLVVFLQTRPVEASIPPEARTRYQDFAAGKMMGITPDGYPYLGVDNAPSVIEEFGSFSCIVCQGYHGSTFLNLLDEIKAGRLKFIFMPLPKIGEFNSEVATRGALCAAQQGKFWEFNDILFDWQTRYGTGANDPRRLNQAAGELGLDTGAFSACLDSQPPKDTISKSEALAQARGVSGTPTIYLDGQLIQPMPNGQAGPNLSELRGLIESKAAAKK
jgi:protein-disulfide isomerase